MYNEIGASPLDPFRFNWILGQLPMQNELLQRIHLARFLFVDLHNFWHINTGNR